MFTEPAVMIWSWNGVHTTIQGEEEDAAASASLSVVFNVAAYQILAQSPNPSLT